MRSIRNLRSLPVLGLTLAGLLALAVAFAGGARAGDLTIIVVAPQYQGPAPSNPDSVIPELSNVPVDHAAVTVTSLEPGMAVIPGDPPRTGSDGKLVVANLDPGVYKIETEAGGVTSTTYVTVGDTGTTSAGVNLTGMPSSESANGGTEAVANLSNTATAALNAGDNESFETAMADLQALSNQDGLAVEQLESIADEMMGELPPSVQKKLEKELANANTPEEAAAAIEATIEKIAEDAMAVKKAMEKAGLKYKTPLEVYEYIKTLERLEQILRKLKEHQERLEKTKEALKQIANAAADSSQSSADVQRRMNMMQNVQRQFAIGRRPRPHRPPAAHRPPVHRPRVEHPRGGIQLSIPSGRR